MYLFAWSDALWARTGDRLGVDLLESQDQLPIDEVAQGWRSRSKRRRPACLATSSHSRRRNSRRGDHPRRVRQALKDDWDASRDPAVHYGASVRNVRRLLANVATYTIFDDHEITDDWYLNRHQADLWRGVTDRARRGWTAEIGPRLLRNGLSAYAIFQHWGNEPADFGAAVPTARSCWGWERGRRPGGSGIPAWREASSTSRGRWIRRPTSPTRCWRSIAEPPEARRHAPRRMFGCAGTTGWSSPATG